LEIVPWIGGVFKGDPQSPDVTIFGSREKLFSESLAPGIEAAIVLSK
jgi:hypothetical protein